jgi:hypothetical protein
MLTALIEASCITTVTNTIGLPEFSSPDFLHIIQRILYFLLILQLYRNKIPPVLYEVNYMPFRCKCLYKRQIQHDKKYIGVQDQHTENFCSEIYWTESGEVPVWA